MKLDLTKPYLTRLEAKRFKESVQWGAISPFRMRRCEGVLNMDSEVKPLAPCLQDIPSVYDDKDGQPLKRYCSERCYNDTENPQDDTEEEEESW
jgi:hypothetical protein